MLIEGESGTGKELIAAAFHFQSPRAELPFVRINCAAIPQDLIESELFGYRKGAFTGADRDKRGLIEATAGGTLLLDEIAEMPMHLQTKLLRVLQERKLRRLGDEAEISVDFRLVSSTNRDTAQMIQEGTFRKDLYFRISTIKVKAPPLSERLDDVPLLAERFLKQYSEKYKKRIREISTSAFALLMRYDWPGNVRELESVIEHAVLFATEDKLTPESLPEQLHTAQAGQFRCVIPPYMSMEEIEREAIAQTLERTGGNVRKTAEILKYHRPRLYRKMKSFGLRGGGDDENQTERTKQLANARKTPICVLWSTVPNDAPLYSRGFEVSLRRVTLWPSIPHTTQKSKKKKILIIEDETSVADALRIILEDGGYRVSLASTGQDGIEEARRGQFCLTITDVGLTDMTGFDVINAIGQHKPRTHFIIITSSTSEEVITKARSFGTAGVLLKPFLPSEILHLIRITLASR